MVALKHDAGTWDACYKKTTELMEQAHNRLWINDPEAEKIFHSKKVHSQIQYERDLGNKLHPRQIFLPLKQKLWSEEWRLYYKNMHVEPALTWPQYSTYFYTNEIIYSSEQFPVLHSGYALYENGLVPCSFFTCMKMTDQIMRGEKHHFPETFAIDPLAVKLKKQPDCYIGIGVNKSHLEEWALTGYSGPHPVNAAYKDLAENHQSTY